jgi:hypothetical protein
MQPPTNNDADETTHSQPEIIQSIFSFNDWNDSVIHPGIIVCREFCHQRFTSTSHEGSCGAMAFQLYRVIWHQDLLILVQSLPVCIE